MNGRKRVKPTIINSHQKRQSKNTRKKRLAQDSASSCSLHNEKKSRSSGGDTIASLRGKTEKDF